VTSTTKEEAELEAQMALLQQEARRLDSVSTFVQWSKVQRNLQALQKKRDRLHAAARLSLLRDWPLLAFVLRQLLHKVALPLVVVAWWWNKRVAVVEGDNPAVFGPWIVSSWLAMPGWPPGTVGVVAWVAICQTVAGLLLLHSS